MDEPVTPRAELSLERSFSVCAHDETPARVRRVAALSFLDAAIAFLGAYGPQEPWGEVSLLVEDCETGERWCLRAQIATAGSAACG